MVCFCAMSRQRYVGLGSVASIHARPSKVWKMYFSDFKHGSFGYLCQISGGYILKRIDTYPK